MAFPGGAQAPGMAKRSQPARNHAQRQAGHRGQRTGNAPRARQQPQGIYDPTQQLAGRSLKQAASTLTNLEINPQVSQLSRQIANINTQSQQAQAKTAGYFSGLGAQAQQALANQQGVSSRLNANLAGIGAQTQQQIGDAGQQAQASLAPLQATGLGGGGFEALVREIAAQRAAAAQNSGTAQSFGAQQGGNFEGLTAASQGTGALRGQERISQLGDAFALQAQESQARRADLLGQKGALFTKNLGALRDSERNYGLARDTLGLNTQKAVLGAQSDAANLQLRSQQFRIETALKDRAFQLDYSKYGLTVARDNYQRARGLGPYKPAAGRAPRVLTPTQRNSAFGSIDGATSAIRQLQGQHYGTSEIRQALANGYYTVKSRDRTTGRVTTKNFTIPRVGDRVLVTAAMDLALNGLLSTASVRALHRYGLKIRGRYRYDDGTSTTGGAVSGGGASYGGF